MLLLVFFYLALPILQVYFFISGQFGIGIFDMLNFTASIMALHWILANVLMATKLPILQKVIPYDERIRFHIISSVGIVVAVLYHGLYKLAIGAFMSPVTISLMVILGTTLLAAVLWIPVPGFRRFRTFLVSKLKRNKETDYDNSKTWHGVFILILGLLLMMHITGAGLFFNVSAFSGFLYKGLYALTFGAYILSRTGLFRTKSKVLAVEEKQGIITIRLQPEKKFSYKSGQFTFLETAVSKGKKEEHPFSFLSSHRQEGEPLSLAVRAVGDFTSDLMSLKPGDYVKLRGSFGNFRPGREEALCFIASGIGTVPILSLLKELHATGDRRPIRLFLAVNHRDELPERDKIMKMAEAMENVEVNFMVSSEDGLRFSEDFFRERIDVGKRYSYYLCSSPGVRTIIVNSLKKLGVRKSAIHYESFSFG